MIHLVISTKGGVGKSTVSSQFVSAYVYRKISKKVNFFEIDDQNESIVRMKGSDLLNGIIVRMENIGKFVEESILFEDDVVVDVGGNNTATQFLQKLKDLGGFASPVTYYIPILDGDQDAKNAKQTFNSIREFDKESKVVFVLNRCTNSSNQELLEREFMDFFGNEILDIEKMHQDENTHYIAINKNTIYNVVGKLNKTITEVANEDVEQEFKDAAIEFHRDKSNQEQYKKVRVLMFLKEQKNIAKNIIENEYHALFVKLDKLLGA